MNKPQITNPTIKEALKAIRDMADDDLILALLYKIYRKGFADGQSSEISQPHREDMGK